VPVSRAACANDRSRALTDGRRDLVMALFGGPELRPRRFRLCVLHSLSRAHVRSASGFSWLVRVRRSPAGRALLQLWRPTQMSAAIHIAQVPNKRLQPTLAKLRATEARRYLS
jgi:hypothetical protein